KHLRHRGAASLDNEGSTMLEEELIEYLDPFSREFVLSIQAFRRLRDLSSELEQDPQSTDVPKALNDILGSKDAQNLAIRFNAVVRQNLNAVLSDIIQQAANLDHGFWPLEGHTLYRGMRNMFVPPDGPYVTRIWVKKIEHHLSSSDNIFEEHDVDDIALPLFDKSDLVAALREVAVDYDIRCNKQDPIHTYFLNNIGQRYIGSQESRTGSMLSSFVRKESLAGEVSRKDIRPESQIDPRIHECQTSCVQIQFRLASRFPEDAGFTENESAPRGTACLATLRGILRARIALQFDRPPDSWKERILYALACLGKTHREHLDNYPSIFLIDELLADGETRQMPCKSKFVVENILVSSVLMDLENADVDGKSDIELAFIDKDIEQPPSSICDTREKHLTKVLPELTVDISDSYAVEGKIKERISSQQRKQFSLDSERLEKIFDAISFRGFPVRNKSIREDLDILPAVAAFRKRLDFVIKQMAAQMLSIKNSKVRHLAINNSLYAFTVANVDAKS
ncbi:MAG: hypothetical protein Q9164_004369, partial [Protoblastenia rupestris]